MNSRIKMLSGSIIAIIGAAILIGVKVAENDTPWYNRADNFETSVKVFTIISIGLIIWGVIDIVGAIISSIYSNKTIESIETQQVQTIECPGCGLRLNKTAKVCPKCGNQLL